MNAALAPVVVVVWLGSPPAAARASMDGSARRCGEPSGPHLKAHVKAFSRTGEVLAWFDANVESHSLAPSIGDEPWDTRPRGNAEGHRHYTKDAPIRIGARARRYHVVCAAPPLQRRTEHRSDRVAPLRPKAGKARRHGVFCRGPNLVAGKIHFARRRAKCVQTSEPSWLHERKRLGR
jgi:hypothetical protein